MSKTICSCKREGPKTKPSPDTCMSASMAAGEAWETNYPLFPSCGQAGWRPWQRRRCACRATVGTRGEATNCGHLPSAKRHAQASLPKRRHCHPNKSLSIQGRRNPRKSSTASSAVLRAKQGKTNLRRRSVKEAGIVQHPMSWTTTAHRKASSSDFETKRNVKMISLARGHIASRSSKVRKTRRSGALLRAWRRGTCGRTHAPSQRSRAIEQS